MFCANYRSNFWYILVVYRKRAVEWSQVSVTDIYSGLDIASVRVLLTGAIEKICNTLLLTEKLGNGTPLCHPHPLSPANGGTDQAHN